eukprot:3897559-Amphidinium_carterae.1
MPSGGLVTIQEAWHSFDAVTFGRVTCELCMGSWQGRLRSWQCEDTVTWMIGRGLRLAEPPL